MRQIFTQIMPSQISLRLLLLLALLLTLVLGICNSLPARAEPVKSDPVQLYCQRSVPAAARKACLNEQNILQARSAASYHCVNHPIAGNRKAACIERRAITYFRDALKATPRPGSPAAFERALKRVLTRDVQQTGGSLTQGSPDANALTSSVQRTAIVPGDLPKVPADTSSIKNILSIVFGIIGAFALLSIVASGLKYITSAGDPQKTSEAKNGVIYSLVGLIVAISAQALVAFVVNRT